MKKMNDIHYFFKNVMFALGHYGWELKLDDSKEGYCWKKAKRIDLGINNSDVKSLLLHEIAHIDTCRFMNNAHWITFWKRYEGLMRKFLPGNVPQARYNEDVGYFGLCYNKYGHAKKM